MHLNVKIKICGLTRLPDARAAAEAGADYLGFILARRSPRFLPPETLETMLAHLPADIPKVGVFADSPPDEIIATTRRLGLDYAQVHDTVEKSLIARLGPERVWPVFSLEVPADAERALCAETALVVIDSARAGKTGGTGQTGNWMLARRVAERRPVILAGGLNAGNVAAALAAVRPFAVDASSGVEDAPGLKNQEKIRFFVQCALCVLERSGW